MNYDKELEFAKQLALEAGKIMLDMFGAAKTEWKADQTPVTEADIAINKLVIETIREIHPEDGVLGEEASYKPGSSRMWVVDPIDGTQPYDAGLPLSTFCLALVVDRTPVLGVVYDPFSDAMYHAVIGRGAFANNRAIHVGNTTALESQYGFVSSRMNKLSMGTAADILINAGIKIFNIRSIAYSLMNLSSGKSIVVIGGRSHPWDLAATMIIIKEAGGMITDLEGNSLTYDHSENGFIASNGVVHDQLVALLNHS